MAIDRRQFLQGAALFSTLGLAPRFLTASAEAQAEAATGAIRGFVDDRVLVVVQLSGGNDGLNTVVPYAMDAYYRARPNLGIRENRVLALDDVIGFHEGLAGLKGLYDNGQLALINNVGYPNPDRSHFRSMEIWHTASDSDAFESTGWLGRYFDNTCTGSAAPHAGLALMRERPQAFDGNRGFGLATTDPERFGWQPGRTAATEHDFQVLNAPEARSGNEALDFLRHTTTQAMASAADVRDAARKANVEVPRGRPAANAQLDAVAGLIRGGLDTRIYYVSAGGFDTHANQAGQHDNLIGRVGDALAAFQAQLERDGTADRVVTLVFSEFGRRVRENGNRGTDHGTAAPLFMIGRNVTPGVYGGLPDLDNLDGGDLRHTVDFRSVYATVLQDWFEVESAPILQRNFDTLPVIA